MCRAFLCICLYILERDYTSCYEIEMEKVRGKNAFGDGAMMYSWHKYEKVNIFQFIDAHFDHKNMHRFLYDPTNSRFYLDKYGFANHAEMINALPDRKQYDIYFRGFIGIDGSIKSIRMTFKISDNMFQKEKYVDEIFDYYEFLADHGVDESVHTEGLGIYDEWYQEHERQLVQEIIRKLPNGKYRLYSRKKMKNGKRRNLGTFDTKEQAKNHEREIHAFQNEDLRSRIHNILAEESRTIIKMSDIVLEVIEQWKEEDGMTPLDINHGNCDLFAQDVYDRAEKFGFECLMLPDEMGLEDEGHVWVYCKDDGKHYDAETPYGVSDWKDLPFFKENKSVQ